MPEANKHQKQYDSNIKLLQSPVFNIDKTKHSDWFITIVFYSAIHIIEKELSSISQHPQNHKERDNLIRVSPKLKRIHSQYIALQNQSRLARYACHKFIKKDIEYALKYLKEIEQTISA